MQIIKTNYYSGYKLCGPVQYDDTGTITSVDEDLDGFYDDNVKCTWIIKPQTQYKMIKLEVSQMAIESSDNCEKDNIKVSLIFLHLRR